MKLAQEKQSEKDKNSNKTKHGQHETFQKYEDNLEEEENHEN